MPIPAPVQGFIESLPEQEKDLKRKIAEAMVVDYLSTLPREPQRSLSGAQTTIGPSEQPVTPGFPAYNPRLEDVLQTPEETYGPQDLLQDIGTGGLKTIGKGILGGVPLAIGAMKKLKPFSKEAIRIANSTSRNTAAIGEKALVPRYVESIAQPNMRILDFGSGKDAAHALRLRNQGLDVTAYEFGDNIIEGIHDPNALQKTYDIVYASNVANVQSSPAMLKTTINQIFESTNPGGKAIINLPLDPRKFDALDAELLEKTLKKQGFVNIERVGGTKSAPVLSAERPLVSTSSIPSPITGALETKSVPPIVKEGMGKAEDIKKRFGFWQDNPTLLPDAGNIEREWLADNPRAITAGYKNLSINPQKLLSIPGARGEEKKIESALVNKLSDSIKAEGFRETDKPLIIVDNFGNPRIYEGNHRIRAAVESGLDSIPIEVRYEGGSEMLPNSWNPIKKETP